MSDPTCSAALDTSSTCASFVVRRDRDGAMLVEEHRTKVGRRSAGLLAIMEQQLAAAELAWSDIGHWTVGMGPGSFTGIRVGAALVRGICGGTGAVCRGVPSSLAMALAGEPAPGETVHVLHDGRQSEAMVSTWRLDASGVRQEGETRVVPLDAFPLDECRCLVLGHDPLAEILAPALGDRLRTLPWVDAAQLLDADAWAWGGEMDPVYVRPAVFVPPLGTDLPPAAAYWLNQPAP